MICFQVESQGSGDLSQALLVFPSLLFLENMALEEKFEIYFFLRTMLVLTTASEILFCRHVTERKEINTSAEKNEAAQE